MPNGFMGWFNKRGLSEVIVSLIVISLSIVAIVLVWVVVNNLISSQINLAERQEEIKNDNKSSNRMG